MISKLIVFNRQKQNNDIVNHEVDDIILQENSKVSAEAEAQESIYSEIEEKDLYNMNDMSIDENKQNA